MEALTVAGLIDHLQTFPQNSFIVIDGYEWGVGRIDTDDIHKGVATNPHGLKISVVYIGRENNMDTNGMGCSLKMKSEDNPFLKGVSI